MKKSISIALIGKPNVGKSTLFNTCTNTKSAIVTHKPQTTRESQIGAYENELNQFYFIDTPGYHKQKNKLDLFLNGQVKQGLCAANVVLFLIDATRKIDEEDKKIRQLLKNMEIENLLIVFTKSDVHQITDPKKIYQQLELSEDQPFVSLNCHDHMSVNDLFKKIKSLKLCFKGENQVSDQFIKNDSWIVKEVIRQQALLLLKQEIPYGIAVEIKKSNFDQEKNLFEVEADIVVEKESHKAIVVGKQGKIIKAIGTRSRLALLEVYDCKIYLKLFVRVEKDWRNNAMLLKQFGYSQS